MISGSKESESRPQPTLMTRETYERLQNDKQKLQRRIADVRFGLRDAAGGFGEWHDSFAFEDGHRQIDMFSNQLFRLLSLLRDVEFIEPNLDTRTVDLGNKVCVRDDEGRIEEFTILAPADYGTRTGWIPYTAPFARAIIGCRVGDKVTYETFDKNQRVEIEILRVEPGDFK